MKEFSILVVDDSYTDRYLLKRVIQKTDVDTEIFEAGNGQEALDFFSDYKGAKKTHGEKFPPVIIFLDINMPVLDGFGFLEEFAELRKTRPEYEFSVLMLYSSSDNENDKEKALSYNFVSDFILKGSTGPKELRKKIKKVIETKFS